MGRRTRLFAGWYSVLLRESDSRTAFVFVDELTTMDSTQEAFTRSFAGLAFLVTEIDGKWRVQRRWDSRETGFSDEEFLRIFSESSIIGSAEGAKMMAPLRAVVRSLDPGQKGAVDQAFADWFFTRESIRPLSEVDGKVWVRNREQLQDSVHTDFVVELRLSRFRDEGNDLDGSDFSARLEMSDSHGQGLSVPKVLRKSARGIYEVDGNPLIGTLRATLVVWEDWVEPPESFGDLGFPALEQGEGD